MAWPGVGAGADDGGDVDDAAVAGAQHRPQGTARDAEGGGEVGVDDALPGIVAELGREAVVADAGVVHQDQDGAVLLLERGEAGVERLGVADVARDEGCGAAAVGDLLGHRLGSVGIGAVVDGHGPAVLSQGAGHGGADAARAAGDESAAFRRSVAGLSTHRGPPIRRLWRPM